LSEEGKDIPYEERRKWKRFWMVDPLDGTKEFIRKNGEFTVNIALILETETIFGAVYVPVSKTLYYGGKSIRARKEIYETGQTTPSEMPLSENPQPLSLEQKTSI